MTNTQRYAQREIDILLKSLPDPDNRPIIEPFIPEILALCEKFGNSGQSGGSAPYTATALSQAIKKLCLQEPICDITGLDDEWIDVSELGDGVVPAFQNARCGAIFKDSKDGRAYYLDAIVWKGDKLSTFTGSAKLGKEVFGSRQYIKSFPFKPKTFYIDVIDDEVKKDWWEHRIKNPSQLKRVWKYYDQFTQI